MYARLAVLEKRPIAYATYWIQSEHCNGLRETSEGTTDMSEIDIFALLQQSPSLPISNIRDRVMVRSLFGDIALALRATPGTPAILLERLIYSGSDVIALEVSTWRHDALLVESTMG
ncbi:UTRA domain-containing protein [Vibrio sp. PP-XX7]